MHTIAQIMQIRSELVNTLNRSGLTIDTALLLIKDIYNELYIAGLESQMMHGSADREFSKEETIEISHIEKEEDKNNGE